MCMYKKACINLFTVFLLLSGSAFPCLVYGQPKQASDPLERRLDTLLRKMSMQEKIEQLYYLTDSNARLSIPPFTGSDGPHGIGNNAKGFSSFPVTIAMAATWDPDLVLRVGRAISLEQAARGKDRIAGPTLDMLIDPRIGRAPETVGEDPFLAGRISAAFVQGQNTTSVFGSIKHYNLNTYELNRRTNNFLSDNRSLVEFWGAHWKRTIQYGGAMSVMCAYNWVNGDKCAENKYLIKNLLRDLWGFNYYTMSDWGGFKETGKALDAELDFCEGNDLYIKDLPAGIRTGLYDSTLVNRAAKNVLRTKIVSGMLDHVPVVEKSVIDSKEHRELVYESGLKGLVLLKNDQQILPLNKDKVKTVAIIGPNADFLPLDGNSSSKVSPAYRISIVSGIRSVIGKDKVVYVKGCDIKDTSRNQFAAALEAAKQADFVLFAGGLDSTLEGEGYFLDKEADEKGGGTLNRPDRPSKTVLLPGVQNELINAIARVNPNVILVVISGGPCSVSPVIQNVRGLLYAFYPGQEGGRAIADVVFGHYNPSGKLPASIPETDNQIFPISTDFRNLVTKGMGYRWYDTQHLTPAFAFGSGISYTTFSYSNCKVNKTILKAGEVIEVSFDLKNTGTRAGEEVAQLYISTGKLVPSLTMPAKQLKGFRKIFLNPGESEKIVFQITAEELYVYNDETKAYEVPRGEYRAWVGSASDKLPLNADFKLTAAKGKSDLLVTNIRTMPAFPQPGDPVVFMASLINAGTAATQIGDKYKLRFYVDGKEVASFFSNTLAIPAGGMVLACGQGINGKNWTPGTGKFTITARIEASDLKELATGNNSCEGQLVIPGGKVIATEIFKLISK
jgi:beta-glucosidase